jgi:transcription elongation factor GreA
MDHIPMSRQGYEKLKADLDRMKNDEMPRVTARIGKAREFGDLSENAEYHAAREEQGHLQARIVDLETRLSRAYLIDPSKLPTDQVAFGARVRVMDETFDEEEEYHLVGPGEEDYAANKILITSPIGQALLGKRIGDVGEVKIPKGVRKLRVLAIAF